MQILCVAVFVLGLTGCALGPGPDDRAGRPPNVVFVMADERIYTGMVQSENDRVVRIKTVAGESIELAKTNLVSRTESALSLMPDNFGDALDQATFNHLMRYLLLQK